MQLHHSFPSLPHLTEVGLGLGLHLVGLVPGGHVLGKPVVERELLTAHRAVVRGAWW